MKNYIMFFDSGIGGLSTLKESLNLFSSNYIYFGDKLHCPYGKRSKKEICSLLKEIIENMLKSYNIKIIVLACNTATTSAISFLRKQFPKITFIGTEPAIALAQKNGYKKILMVATNTTINQKKYKLLKKSVNAKIKSIGLEMLAKKIENYYENKSIFNNFELIKEIFYIKKYLKNYECLVLGCTHYSLIKDKFKRYIHKPIFDGNYGVAKMLTQIIAKHYSNDFKQNAKSQVKMFISGKNNMQYQKYKKILNQILAINFKMW